VTLTLPDLLAGVRAHATPGHRASGAWLAAVPGEHLLEIMRLDGLTPDGPTAESALVLSKVMIALLRAERGEPVPALSSIEQGVLYTRSLGPAAKLEVMRRQGAVTVDPPLRSIFNPGDSIVQFSPTFQKEPA
jgi:hypothetical protein